MTLAKRCLVIVFARIFVLAVPLPALAAPAKKGTVGVIEVEYEMTSQGSRKGTDSQEEWHGKRLLTIAFEVLAGDVQATPVTLVGAPKGKNSFAARSETVAKENAPAQKRLEAAMRACKHDKDCEARATSEFMNSDAGKKAMADSMAISREVAGKGGAPRYQFWSPAGANGKPRALSGTYAVDQHLKIQTYDPLCGKTNNICTEVREVKGSGPLTAEGLELLKGFLGMEGMLSGGVVLDTKEQVLTVGIPHPNAVIEVVENVQSSIHAKTSTKKKEPWLAQAQKWDDGLGVADLPCPEPLKELRGEIRKKVYNGYAPTMTVRWRFAVKP